MELGEKLKQARGRAGLKQEELAQKIGVSRQTVSNWENNRSYPDIGSVLKLSDLYGLSVDEMLKEDTGMRRHVEESTQRFKGFADTLREVALVILMVAWPFHFFGYHTFAMVLTVVSFPAYFLSLYLEIKLLHMDWRAAVLDAGAWILQAVAHQVFRFTGNFVYPLYLGGWSLNTAARYLLEKTGYQPRRRLSWFTGFALAAVLMIPIFVRVSEADTKGSFNEANPFDYTYYKVAQVLHTETPEADLPIVHLSGSNTISLGSSRQVAEKLNGTFSHVPLPENSELLGVWEMIPEDASGDLYRVTVDAENQVTLSFSRQEKLRWKYLLESSEILRVSWLDQLGAGVGYAAWFYPDTFDATLENTINGFKVDGKAEFALVLADPEVTELTLYEQYHYQSRTEESVYQLRRNDKGSFTFETAARYEGAGQWSLCRIPYDGGEFVFDLTYRP